MLPIAHELNHARKELEVAMLLRVEFVFPEELDHMGQILQATNPKFLPIAVVHGDLPTIEERLQAEQDLLITLMLHDPKLGKNLPPNA